MKESHLVHILETLHNLISAIKKPVQARRICKLVRHSHNVSHSSLREMLLSLLHKLVNVLLHKLEHKEKLVVFPDYLVTRTAFSDTLSEHSTQIVPPSA